MKEGFANELVDFDDLMWMRGGTGEQDIPFVTCDAATGEVWGHWMSLDWRNAREGRGIRYYSDPRLEEVDWEIFGDLIFMDLTENHIKVLSGDFHASALVRFLDPSERDSPRLVVMLHKAGGDAEEAL